MTQTIVLPRFGNTSPDLLRRIQDIESVITTGGLPNTGPVIPPMGGPFLPLAGGTMTGPLLLQGGGLAAGYDLFGDFRQPSGTFSTSVAGVGQSLQGGSIRQTESISLNRYDNTARTVESFRAASGVSWLVGTTVLAATSDTAFTQHDVGKYVWGGAAVGVGYAGLPNGLAAYIVSVDATGNATLDRPCVAGGPHTDAGCGTTSGSPTVTDTAANATYVGAPVSGAGIPIGASIDSVVAGVSFHMVTTGTSTPLNATATATVTLTIQSGAPHGITIHDVQVGSPFNLVLNQTLDLASGTVAMAPINYFANQGPRGIMSVDGVTTAMTNVSRPLLFQSMTAFKNAHGVALTGIGPGLMMSISDQIRADGANITLHSGFGLCFVDNVLWNGDGLGNIVDGSATNWYSLSNQFGVILGSSIGEYATVWANTINTTAGGLVGTHIGMKIATFSEGSVANLGIQMFADNATFTAEPHLTGIQTTSVLTHNYANVFLRPLINWNPTFVLQQSAYSLNTPAAFQSSAVLQNEASTNNVNLGAYSTVTAQNSYQAIGQTASIRNVNEFWSSPTYATYGGTLSASLSGSHAAFRSSMTLSTTGMSDHIQLPPRYGLQYSDTTQTGPGTMQLVKQYGVYIPYLTGALASIGISNGSAYATPPPPTRTPTAHYEIIPDATYIVLTGTSAITLGNPTGSVPCIAPGITNGQRLTLAYIGFGSLTFTDKLGVGLGQPTFVMPSGSWAEWIWSTSYNFWVLTDSTEQLIVTAPSPVAAAWAPNGFISSTGQYTIGAVSAAAGVGAFVNFAPTLQYSSSAFISSHEVVQNHSILANAPGSASITLRNSFTVSDQQTIRSDTQTTTIGNTHYSASSSVTFDSIGGGLFATKPNVYAGYSLVTAKAAAGQRFGWYFDNVALIGVLTTNIINSFTAAQIVPFGTSDIVTSSTAAPFFAADVGQPILDAAGIIPSTAVTASQNIATAAFVGGTGILTLTVAVSTLTTGTYTFPTSGNVAVFINCATTTAAAAAAPTAINLISYTGVSGSTLTGCKNLSIAGAGTVTTHANDVCAYMCVASVINPDAVALPTGALTRTTISTGIFIGESTLGNGDWVAISSATNAFTGMTGYRIDDNTGGTNIAPGSTILSVSTTTVTDDTAHLSLPSPTYPGPLTGTYTYVVTTALQPPTTTASIIVDTPQVTPAGSLTQQRGFYSAQLNNVGLTSGASAYNIAYGWDDGSGTLPATAKFYGIYSPGFNVDGNTGATSIYTTAPATQTVNYNLLLVANAVAITNNGPTAIGGITVAPVMSYTAALGAFGAYASMLSTPTHQNTAGSSITTGAYRDFYAAPVLATTDTTAMTFATVTNYHAAASFSVFSGGALTVGTMRQLDGAAVTVPTGATVTTFNQIDLLGPVATGTITTRRAINIASGSGAGTFGTQVGIDIAALTGAGTNIGIRNASSTQLGSSAQCVVDTSGNVDTSGHVLSSSATAGHGYATGAGGTSTQITSKATAFPTISKVCGTLTWNNAALAADTTVTSASSTNTAIAATDVVVFTHISGGTLGAYNMTCTPGAGTWTLSLHNTTAGSLSEAPVFAFAIIKAVTA